MTVQFLSLSSANTLAHDLSEYVSQLLVLTFVKRSGRIDLQLVCLFELIHREIFAPLTVHSTG